MLTGILYACLYFLLLSLVTFLLLLIGDVLVPAYRLWDEVQRGNTAVGMSVGGKMIGLGIIAMIAIQHNETVLQSAIWTAVGGVLQIAGYFLFEALTPRIAVGKELAADNRAVGLVSAGISIGLSFIIAGCIA